jgi:malate/lactate dehydrogenase
MIKFHYIECACLSPLHTLRFYLDEDNQLSVETYLNCYYPWYKRIWIAFKYVIGYNNSGAFDETILNQDSQNKLRELLDVRTKTT